MKQKMINIGDVEMGFVKAVAREMEVSENDAIRNLIRDRMRLEGPKSLIADTSLKDAISESSSETSALPVIDNCMKDMIDPVKCLSMTSHDEVEHLSDIFKKLEFTESLRRIKTWFGSAESFWKPEIGNLAGAFIEAFDIFKSRIEDFRKCVKEDSPKTYLKLVDAVIHEPYGETYSRKLNESRTSEKIFKNMVRRDALCSMTNILRAEDNARLTLFMRLYDAAVSNPGKFAAVRGSDVIASEHKWKSILGVINALPGDVMLHAEVNPQGCDILFHSIDVIVKKGCEWIHERSGQVLLITDLGVLPAEETYKEFKKLHPVDPDNPADTDRLIVHKATGVIVHGKTVNNILHSGFASDIVYNMKPEDFINGIIIENHIREQIDISADKSLKDVIDPVIKDEFIKQLDGGKEAERKKKHDESLKKRGVDFHPIDPVTEKHVISILKGATSGGMMDDVS